LPLTDDALKKMLEYSQPPETNVVLKAKNEGLPLTDLDLLGKKELNKMLEYLPLLETTEESVKVDLN